MRIQRDYRIAIKGVVDKRGQDHLRRVA